MSEGKYPRWMPLLRLSLVMGLVFALPFAVLVVSVILDWGLLQWFGFLHLGIAQVAWWAWKLGRVYGSIY